MLKLLQMRKILFFLVLLVSTLTSNAQSILNVKVIDQEKLNMPGASVRLMPGNRQVISNQVGLAVFQGLKNGRYTLTIAYIGYQKIDRQIDVKEGVNEIIEQMQSGLNEMKEVMIVGDRLKGQAKALTQQKNNLNITNIVSADQIGRFPDANIGCDQTRTWYNHAK